MLNLAVYICFNRAYIKQYLQLSSNALYHPIVARAGAKPVSGIVYLPNGVMISMPSTISKVTHQPSVN